MAKYANQHSITIRKTPVKSNFLQISNEEWMLAAKTFDKKFAAFKLYLYLAANEVGYVKDLSAVAVEKALGIKSSNYYNCVSFLESEGYLVDRGGGKMDFYTTPQNSTLVENEEKNPNSTTVENSTGMEIEMNDPNSTSVENSTTVEIEEKDINSTRMENSTGVENGYFTFNF